MIPKRDILFLFIGSLITTGIFLIFLGIFINIDIPLVFRSIYAPPIFQVPTEVNLDYAIDIIDSTNKERKKANLEPLKENSALSYAAYLRARDILDNQDFSHIATKSGEIKAQKVIQVVGYRYSEAGENLAMGIEDPNEVVAQWLASPGHRSNTLSKSFNETGVAVLSGEFQGQKDTYIVVQLFGKR